jgi:hypothetical protein
LNFGNCIDNCSNGHYIDNNNNKICNCPDIKCLFCSPESNEINKCLSCNKDQGYYKKKEDITSDSLYFDCYKSFEGYYLSNELILEKCYETCKSCTSKGDENDNKCLDCSEPYIPLKDFENKNNCYNKCEYNYYYDKLDNNKYKCTINKNCPDNYSKLIVDKKRCIDECKNDNTYKYEYENKCYKNCPSNTKISLNNANLCEKIEIIEEDKEKCKLEEKELWLEDNEISENNVNLLTKDYINQFGFSYDYVLKQEDRFYQIFIYKNFTCLQIKANEASEIDFGQCYEKVKNAYEITDDLIITIIKFKGDKKKNIKSTNT